MNPLYVRYGIGPQLTLLSPVGKTPVKRTGSTQMSKAVYWWSLLLVLVLLTGCFAVKPADTSVQETIGGTQAPAETPATDAPTDAFVQEPTAGPTQVPAETPDETPIPSPTQKPTQVPPVTEAPSVPAGPIKLPSIPG